MYFLLSGEGPTDLGRGDTIDGVCDWQHFQPGPLAHVLALLVEDAHCYSILDAQVCRFVDDGCLSRRAHTERKSKIELPGINRRSETLKFRRLARAMAAFAREESQCLGDIVVAVLFRDRDRLATWRQRFDAMLAGFEEGRYDHGVPMIADPISEAWFLEALGVASNPQPPKEQLKVLLGEEPTSAVLNALVQGTYNGWHAEFGRVRHESYVAFRERLLTVLNALH